VSLDRIRFGVRLAAGFIVGSAAVAGGYSISVDHADVGTVLDGVAVVAVIVGIWVLTEAVVGGFEMMARVTQERYEHLMQQGLNPYAIAAQVVLAVESAKCAEDSDKVRVLHR
jgi:hypothetical protein